MSFNRTYLIGILVLFAILLVDANMFFHHYAKQHIDGDQTIFWLYAQDLSQGIFRSPYLYGQDYNIPLESILAAPFIAAGGSYNVVFPLVCTVLSLLPFLLLSFDFFKRGQWNSALLSMAMPLLLPTEWQMITTASRGFVGGIALASLGFFLVSKKNVVIRSLGYSMALLSILVNPNAIIFLVPFGLYHLFHHRFRWKELLIPTTLFVAILIYLRHFRLRHEDNFVHHSWNLKWSISNLIEHGGLINSLFKGVAPVFYEIGFLLVLIILIFSRLSVTKGDKQMKWLFETFFYLLVFSLGVNKVGDGTNSVFFPYSRMFLAIPLVLLLLFSELERLGALKKKLISFLVIMICSIGFYIVKFNIQDDRISRAFKTDSGVVQVHHSNELERSSAQFKDLVHKTGASVLVFYSKADGYVYGSAVLDNVPTLYPKYERRQWLLEAYKDIPMEDVLIIDWSNQFEMDYASQNPIRIEESRWPVYMIKKKDLSLSYLYP